MAALAPIRPDSIAFLPPLNRARSPNDEVVMGRLASSHAIYDALRLSHWPFYSVPRGSDLARHNNCFAPGAGAWHRITMKLHSRLKAGLLLAGLASSLSYGAATPLVNHGDSWRYRKGTNAPQADWKTSTDAALDPSWLTGNGGIGYANNANETQLCQTLLTDMINKYRTVYMRSTFTIASAVNTNAHLQLTMDFDDGFIVWLDGVYLTNRCVTGAPTEPAFSALANTSHESSHGDSGPQAAEIYDFGLVGSRLPVGTHVLAIIGLNNTTNSSDFIMVPDLALVTNVVNCISGAISVNTTWYA